MKKYQLVVTWTMSAVVDVDAESFEAAVNKAYDANLPNGEYVPNSFEVHEEESKELYRAE